MHLLDLNDACLGRIFQLLDLYECEQVRRVCSRFEQIVNYYCQDIYKSWKKNPLAVNKNGNNLTWMAEVVGNLVEILDLRGITAEEFHMLNEFQFPKVKALRICTTRGYTPNMLAKVFPQLLKLFITGCGLHLFYPKELCKLEKLQELELHYMPANARDEDKFNYCFSRKDQEYKYTSFCSTRYVNEFLHINRMEIFSIKLAELPRLQRITDVQLGVDINNSPLKYILKGLGHCVATLQAELIVYMDAIECFRYLNILRELTVECSYLIDNVGLPKPSKAKLYLTHVIRVCSTLEVLALPYQWIDEEFKASLVEDLINATEHRNGPLELRALVRNLKTFHRKNFITEGVPGLLVITIAEYPKSSFNWDESFIENFVITLDQNHNS